MTFFAHGGISKKNLCGIYNYPKWNFKSCVRHGSTNANLKFLEAELATNAQEIWVNGPSVNEKPVNPKGKLLKFHKNSGKPTVS